MLQLSKAQKIWIVFVSAVLMTVMVMRTADFPGANSGSRYSTVDSLVHFGTYKINNSVYRRTIDKVKYKGDYYSSKPPLFPTAVAGVYWFYNKITGNSLRDFRNKNRNIHKTIYHLNILCSVLPYLLLMFFFCRYLCITMKNERALLVAYTVFCLNCLVAGYATDLNNHSPAAITMFLLFYLITLIRRTGVGTKVQWCLVGLLTGLLVTFEIPSLIVASGVFIYLFLIDKRSLIYISLPFFLLPILFQAYLTYLATGSMVPIYFRHELYHYPGSYWSLPKLPGIDGLDEPKHIYFFHMMLGHHGVFSLTPVFFFAVYKLVQSIKQRKEDFREALLILGSFTVMALAYMIRTKNYGGLCVGFRWLLFFSPLLMLYVARWIEEDFKRWRPLFLFCVVFGFGTLYKATLNPWSQSYLHRFMNLMGWT